MTSTALRQQRQRVVGQHSVTGLRGGQPSLACEDRCARRRRTTREGIDHLGGQAHRFVGFVGQRQQGPASRARFQPARSAGLVDRQA